MKKIFIVLIIMMLSLKVGAQHLDAGYYRVCFTDSNYKSYKLKIWGEKFLRYYTAHDSVSGTLKRIGQGVIYFYENTKTIDSVEGPLKEMYKSWGLPIVVILDKKKLSRSKKYFRTTFEMNYHITVNTGYFERITEKEYRFR
ncbi:hypothetical protein [Pedobacter sp.]|jgi:hypothetical protein|uniref:hypothetical protein n=1 Tax=Pedobacter sp. TaxID=1411316 RepID=UPI002BB13513|nr:hypothetical protein [Pedobacter sp.]HWW41538.1 hypothetical protein [Pedobacter sp.]